MEKNVNRPVPEADLEKKIYHSPKLFVYGNIPEITQTVGQTGKNDGGGALMTKTDI